MSLVGPRPLLMEYLERYTPEQMRRHDVKPGMTGCQQEANLNQEEVIMALETITLHFPSRLYKQVYQRAAKKMRTIEDEVIAVVENACASEEKAADALIGLPLQITEQVRQLSFLDEHHLWQAAKRVVSPEKSERMQELIFKQQSEGLTKLEEQEANQLVMYANLVMLIRAEAAVLLQERGLDISGVRAPISN